MCKLIIILYAVLFKTHQLDLHTTMERTEGEAELKQELYELFRRSENVRDLLSQAVIENSILKKGIAEVGWKIGIREDNLASHDYNVWGRRRDGKDRDESSEGVQRLRESLRRIGDNLGDLKSSSVSSEERRQIEEIRSTIGVWKSEPAAGDCDVNARDNRDDVASIPESPEEVQRNEEILRRIGIRENYRPVGGYDVNARDNRTNVNSRGDINSRWDVKGRGESSKGVQRVPEAGNGRETEKKKVSFGNTVVKSLSEK